VIATLRRLLALAAAPRSRVALAVVLGALTIAFGVGLMATAGYLISRAAERPAVLSLTTAIVAVRFFGLGRPILRYLERLVSHDIAFRALTRVRGYTYERIEPLAPAGLEGYRRGDLLSRFVADVDALQNLHLRGVGPPLVALAAGALSVGATAAILPSAGLVLAAGLLVGGTLVPAAAVAVGARAAGRQAAARGRLAAELVDVVRAAPELAVYGQEDERLGRVLAADKALVDVTRRDALAGGIGDGLGLVVTGMTVAAVLALAVSAHTHRELDRVLIALLALLALASFEAVQPLPAAARELMATITAGRRLLEVADREPAVVDPVAPAPAPPDRPAIELENVCARYGAGERPALEGFNLRLEPGRRVALVGPSGAGKTTVANLLLRFLDPEAGRVTVAGRDLREYRQQDVRRAIALAGQESYLFSTSIRENVRLARPGATDAELEQALRRAQIWDWVESLPQGWDTLVGEEGREVSGGQRQRIALARALLADSGVLVLDEPTGHLDAATAADLMRDVFDAAGGRSVLLITHRPEGLDLVDEVHQLGAGLLPDGERAEPR
jgi:ATP-binding cassette, subfamily C, bacterial CydC